MPLNYESKRWVSVPYAGGRYVYQTNVPDKIQADLGITAFDPYTAVTGAFYKANSPKPPRMSKESATTGHDGSFADKTKIAALRKTGWKVSSKERRRRRIYKASQNKKLITVYVTVAGVKYAWDMNRGQYTVLQADFAGLGIEEATDTDLPTLVFGASVPKPAQVQKTVITGDEINSYETYCSQAKEDGLPEAWVVVEPRIIFGPDYTG